MATVDPAGHREFEQLAVQHVLGGLPMQDSSRFREHLTQCSTCRQRVVELRDIAADLETAAREERAAARIKVETERRDPPPAPDEEPGPVSPEVVRNAIAVFALVGVAILAFWNVHLASVRDALLASLDDRGAVLESLVDGQLLEADIRVTGMKALVSIDRGAVAIDASGLPQVLGDRRIVLWSVDEAGDHTRLATVVGSTSTEGRLLLHVDDVTGVQLVLSLEAFPVGETPAGTIVMTADLRPDA